MIQLAAPYLSKNAEKYVLECLRENQLSSGRFNVQFENMFSEFTGSEYASTCANGTVALWLALKALGIKEGDEVIVPTLTFAASGFAVVLAGAKPVFVDIDEQSWNISPAAVEAAMNPRVKAIMPVHLYGVPCEMDEIRRIADAHHVEIVEDAAEAIGATYKGTAVGSLGSIGCFSFYGNKVLTTGEGGMCTTQNKELKTRLDLFRSQGQGSRRYWHEVVGTNARMTNLQAALGVSQMEDAHMLIEKRRAVFAEYKKQLGDVGNISFATPPIESLTSPWLITIRVHGRHKEQMVKALEERGVESRPGFYPCHLMPAFAAYSTGDFPVALSVSEELLNLPTHPGLSKEDILSVCDVLRAVLA